jgi:hypothetical protein
MGALLDIRLKEVQARLASHKITIDVSADAREWLCKGVPHLLRIH